MITAICSLFCFLFVAWIGICFASFLLGVAVWAIGIASYAALCVFGAVISAIEWVKGRLV
jgi:hypothetical protein